MTVEKHEIRDTTEECKEIHRFTEEGRTGKAKWLRRKIFWDATVFAETIGSFFYQISQFDRDVLTHNRVELIRPVSLRFEM